MSCNVRRYKVRWFRIWLFVLVGYFFYVLAGQQSQLAAIRQDTEVSRQQLEKVAAENKILAEEKNKLQTTSYVEKIAREELGMTKPGEVPYIPAGKN